MPSFSNVPVEKKKKKKTDDNKWRVCLVKMINMERQSTACTLERILIDRRGENGVSLTSRFDRRFPVFQTIRRRFIWSNLRINAELDAASL